MGKKLWMAWPALVICALFLTACGGGRASDDGVGSRGASSFTGGGANTFNPWMNASLPRSRELSSEGRSMLGSMGGRAQSIEGETSHRPHARNELYPVVFGAPRAPHEIIVLLDFADPRSERVWKEVMKASRSLDPKSAKIVVFGNSREHYGADLMGLAIWISYSRQGQAMAWLDHALTRWNAVKRAQKAAGRLVTFNHEYDAVASPRELPIHYAYLARLKPPVPRHQEPDVARYCYDAGNVNMYQAVQVARHYGVGRPPAVIVDGAKVSPDAASILRALR